MKLNQIYQSLTPYEKKKLIGEIQHVIQYDSASLLEVKRIIEIAKSKNLFSGVTLMPN